MGRKHCFKILGGRSTLDVNSIYKSLYQKATEEEKAESQMRRSQNQETAKVLL